MYGAPHREGRLLGSNPMLRLLSVFCQTAGDTPGLFAMQGRQAPACRPFLYACNVLTSFEV